MAAHPQAGLPPEHDQLISQPQLIAAYYSLKPSSNPSELVSFGTSGHRGSALNKSFNEDHILAICQAIVEYRQQAGITGPLYLGKDTHALSEPAFISALQVLLANGVSVVVQQDGGFTPTPVISRLIIAHNRQQSTQSDGVIITPSHNPPEDGGIKYNPPHGGPAEGEITSWIEQRANALIANQLAEVHKLDYEQALQQPNLQHQNFIEFYTGQLASVIDFAAIANSKIAIGVDPLGGAGLAYWPAIAKHYNLNLTVVNEQVDPAFAFMPLDKDGKIRMDCSSPYAMAGLIALKHDFDIAIGNDPDFDRHGIVSAKHGLMNPNHFLAVAIHYLYTHRNWPANVQVGKTLVSSSIIDRVCKLINRSLCEVPVGFKWFVDGLASGQLGFGGEESAGASFIQQDGQCWTTDKDGFVMGLLAAEIMAVTGKDPHDYYLWLVEQVGKPFYGRVEAVADRLQKQALSNLSVDVISQTTLAGESIVAAVTHAAGNQAAIGGLKVQTANGWFAARPSGTEDIYKIYAESFIDETHLRQIISEAQLMVTDYFARQGL